MIENAYLGRQPILDRGSELIAYELLFRSGEDGNFADVLDAKKATSQVIINVIINFGLDKILGKAKGFINLDREMLFDHSIESIPQEQFVLEILEDVKVDELLIDRVAMLHEQGYTFALDDITSDEAMLANFEPLLKYVEIIKIDYMFTDRSKLKELCEQFKRKGLLLLAEKIESEEEFRECRKLGFDYFQGFFFEKPTIIKGAGISPMAKAVSDLTNKLSTVESMDALEREFGMYPDISISLLKLVNSASTGLRAEVESIKHAISLMGREKLKSWLLLFLYNESKDNEYYKMLLRSALFRASVMSDLAKLKLKKNSPQKAYLVGILSLMGALFKKSLEESLEGFSLNSEITDAVLKRDNNLGKLLTFTEVIEKGDFKRVSAISKKLKIEPAALSEISAKAYALAESVE